MIFEDIKVVKRNGKEVDFQLENIRNAIKKCFNSIPSELTEDNLEKIISNVKLENVMQVERIQDAIESSLISLGFIEEAKAFIRYRDSKSKIREAYPITSEEVDKFKENKKKFKDPLAEFVFFRSYARWNEAEGRRETWEEAVDRVITYYKSVTVDKISDAIYEELREGMLNFEVVPSMRCLAMAGPALERCQLASYNCSYLVLDSIQSFAELMYACMSGTGVGFSVEYCNSDKMPRVKPQRNLPPSLVAIGDTTEDWCDALKIGMEAWFSGNDITFDYSLIRPAGAKLKTKGGFSSGPEVLRRLLDFTREIILGKQGKRLDPIDLHDIACMIGEVVVAGGTRRTALISLSEVNDHQMRHAKDGAFWEKNYQRSMANNSMVYEDKPSSTQFMEEWLSLAKSGTGERGIFNRQATIKSRPKRRKKANFGTNPCGEIALRPNQTCNLTELLVRPDDTRESLLRKVRLATILGTIQSSFTNFKYVSDTWKQNCEEERLLGVSMTGQLDCPLLNVLTDHSNTQAIFLLKELKEKAIEVNKEFAAILGINESVAITCTKPSGTTSIVASTSSGVHPRYSEYYIRRVRINAKDPLFLLAKDSGIPYHPEVGQTEENATTFVLDFPMKSPEGAITRHNLTALDQLEYWLAIKENYAEHSVSCTVYVDDTEWLSVGNWVYEHFDQITGLSFLPKSNHKYLLAPMEEITKEEYDKLMESFPEIDYYKLVRYEKEDKTTSSREIACSGGSCEIL